MVHLTFPSFSQVSGLLCYIVSPYMTHSLSAALDDPQASPAVTLIWFPAIIPNVYHLCFQKYGYDAQSVLQSS